MDSGLQKIHDELKRQGLVDTAHFFDGMNDDDQHPHSLRVELQALWTFASLETRIRKLELEAGVENVRARQLPDADAFEAVRSTLES